MTQLILNWVADAFAHADIIDLYFIVSDLIDIPLTDDERFEQAYFDTMTTRTAENINRKDYQDIPLGKLVV